MTLNGNISNNKYSYVNKQIKSQLYGIILSYFDVNLRYSAFACNPCNCKRATSDNLRLLLYSFRKPQCAKLPLCFFIVYCCSHCLWGFCVCSFFFIFRILFSSSFVIILMGKSWLFQFNFLADDLWQSVFCATSSLCLELVCGVWMWYLLIIRTW